MFVVDFLHEFLLGVWKSAFIHLLRILDALGPHLLNELDARWVLPITLPFLCMTIVIIQLQSYAYLWQRHDPTVLL